MKPQLAELKRLCPDLAEDLLRNHLERLDENYYQVFPLAEVQKHLAGLARLSATHPVEVLFEDRSGNAMACTVLADDYPAEFSLIAGALAATGFNIISGNIFTYRPAAPPHGRAGRPAARRLEGDRAPPAGARRMIIDRFAGVIQTDQSVEDWMRTFHSALREIIKLLARGAPDDLTQARRLVNEMVARRLAILRLPPASVLYPVRIDVSNAGPYTRLRVLAQDTPAFLYGLSSALALQNLSIEQVRINTAGKRIQDEIDILDLGGAKIMEEDRIDKLKLSVLLTKQFTYFLGSAPDPYTALDRFEKMLEAVLAVPDRSEWIKLLSTPAALEGLARLLGTSDFMWEDFIRLQYETLLPILKPAGGAQGFATPPEEFAENLRCQLRPAGTLAEKYRILNELKDRELFLIDLDQILNPAGDVKSFSAALTRLAETIVRAAADLIFQEMSKNCGAPRTVAGLETQWALFGLGKFGGAALGYASDIELLLVFSDHGRTDGPEQIENSEYFGRAARLLTEVIRAKREGIFHVDIRLRPYGESGPLACSLESFCRYYGPQGAAHSYERLALARLRAVAGDRELGHKIERLRDEFIYGAANIKFDELRELREKQLLDKAGLGRYNAKFSPGALVDLEYDIQLLQVMHGASEARLRTPRIHEALEALSALGVLAAEEGQRLAKAYYFFRRLINGLRMLRGSARDLFLPPEDSIEFVHLARRMGYQRRGDLEPEQQLRIDFETQTATVRAFVERHFGRDSLPGKPEGNIADLILSDTVPVALRDKVLAAIGFKNTGRAGLNLRAMVNAAAAREGFAPLAVLAGDAFKQSVDPDRALNNWERYTRAVQTAEEHFALLLAQPKRLEILLGIFAASQFLADTLIRNPEFFNWVTAPQTINQARSRAVLAADLRDFTGKAAHAAWLDALRRFRCREVLRIGTRDICLHAPIGEITADLSALAEAMTQAALEHYARETGVNLADNFCILAFGKLGGGELNYSSDIDLLSVYDLPPPGGAGADFFNQAMSRIANYLAAPTSAGHAYRVDFRLRPYGQAGHLAYSLPALEEYYRHKAALWEIQALLKARPIAGSARLAAGFTSLVQGILRERRAAEDIIAAIETLRKAGAGPLAESEAVDPDIKNGAGGIRDIEFLVQGLQLFYCPARPDLINGNTIASLTLLGQAGLLAEQMVSRLKEDYFFLRRVEHCLQMFEDRQVHCLPNAPEEQAALAKRALGFRATAAELLEAIRQTQKRVRHYCRAVVKTL